MIKGEKMGILSKTVETTYVNRFACFVMWITSVDKSVDNVENSWFSTAIFPFYPRWPPFGICIRLWITEWIFSVTCVLCRQGNPCFFFANFGEKVGIFPKRASLCRLFFRKSKNFLLDLHKFYGCMFFPEQEILFSHDCDAGGPPCRER